jgi:hypothetical protein
VARGSSEEARRDIEVDEQGFQLLLHRPELQQHFRAQDLWERGLKDKYAYLPNGTFVAVLVDGPQVLVASSEDEISRMMRKHPEVKKFNFYVEEVGWRYKEPVIWATCWESASSQP